MTHYCILISISPHTILYHAGGAKKETEDIKKNVISAFPPTEKKKLENTNINRKKGGY